MSSDLLTRVYAEAPGGVLPGTPTFKRITATTDDVDIQVNSTTSNRVTGNRRPATSVRTSQDAGGTHNDELSYGMYDDFFQWSIGSAGWSTAQQANSNNAFNLTFSAPDAAGVQTVTFTGGTIANGAFVAPGWIRIRPMIATAQDETNVGPFQLLSMDDAGGNFTIQNALGVASTATVQHFVTLGEQVIDANTLSQFWYWRKYGSFATDHLAQFPRTISNGFDVSVSQESVMTVSFELLCGLEETITADPWGGTLPALNSVSEVMQSETDVLAIGGDGASFCISDFSMSYRDGKDRKKCLGTEGTRNYNQRSNSFTANYTYDYDEDSAAHYQKFINDEAFNIAFVVGKKTAATADAPWNREAYVFAFDRAKKTSGSRSGDGRDTDLTVPAEIAAESPDGTTPLCRIVRFPAI